MSFHLSNDHFLMGTSVLPTDIFTRVDEEFFSGIKAVTGDCVVKMLRVQLINSARKLLFTDDVFAFLQVECEETDALRLETCFKSRNGLYFVKPGIQTALSKLINLLHQKLNEEQEASIITNAETEKKYVNDEFIDKHPLLKSLINWYKLNDSACNNSKNEFLTSFINNLVANFTQSPNNFRYSEAVKKFATCLYIIGGKQCYEFIRLNLPGAVPNLSLLGELINQSKFKLSEAEFNFESLEQCQSGFGFCSEDTTGVIRRAEYDAGSNSFVGFATPIVDGVPSIQYYTAETFDNLKTIYDTNEIAGLLNVHMFQGISTKNDPTTFSKPLLLSAYGVNNKITSVDILRRWMYIFENCLKHDVRIVGFSTDADNKYLSAMRLASNFFASLPNFRLDKHQHAFEMHIPQEWSWFFLNQNQLFLFFQDPVHLVTKWRNRLLSSSATLRFGNDKITVTHVEKLISDDYTKLDHGLTRSDINPKDRQNYKSCIKLISDDVLNILSSDMNAYGTIVYLILLKKIVKAYINQSTSIRERIQSAWCVVFVCRLWFSWLQKTSTDTISSTGTSSNERVSEMNKCFITRPAYMSVELNAHNLLYLVLLVKQKQLPRQALINIHLFNSQSCESIFRDARSLSGTFSSTINFTVKDFISRSKKLSVLNEMKYNSLEKELSFPVHHKRKHAHSSVTSVSMFDDIDTLDIEQIISDAYDEAIHLVKHSQLSDTLKKSGLNSLNSLSKYVSDVLKKNSRMINYSSLLEHDVIEEFGLDEENDDNDENNSSKDQTVDETPFDLQNDTASDDDDGETVLSSMKSDFNGIKITDKCNPAIRQSFFQLKINGNTKYIHKQSACWLLSNNSSKLSSDRLSRVKQQTADERR